MRILVGGWFSLPRVGRDVFSLLMKQGVAYDKDLGFKSQSQKNRRLHLSVILNCRTIPLFYI